MKDKKTTKGKQPKTKKEKFDLEVYFTRADESARHFIAELSYGLLTEIPDIQSKCKTEEEFAKKLYPVLDLFCDAFTTAQIDAIKCASAQIAETLGAPPLWAPREKKD